MRLIQKWLNAGVLEKGTRTFVEVGSPQGGSASPLLANIYLHYVFDLWVQAWRKKRAHGDVIVVRYADDIVVGFEFKDGGRTVLEGTRRTYGEVSTGTEPGKDATLRVRTPRGGEPKARWFGQAGDVRFSRLQAHLREDEEGDGFWCFGRRFANACRPSCSR